MCSHKAVIVGKVGKHVSIQRYHKFYRISFKIQEQKVQQDVVIKSTIVKACGRDENIRI